MTISPTRFSGVLLLEPRVFADNRGVFFESYNRRALAAAGITVEFVQDNCSQSCRDTVRGLHYQAPPHAQDKLVSVRAGEVFDVIVDLRRGSPTFGQWQSFQLSAANRLSVFIPKGFAHGFCVLSETAEFFYKCSDYYAPESERGCRWDDPAIGIPWPTTTPILSPRDRRLPAFAELPADFTYPG